MKIIFFTIIFINSLLFCEIKKDTKKELKKEYLLEKKIQSLEKKIEVLEKKITTLEKKLLKIHPNEEFQIKFISKEVIENKNKGVVKIEALITNKTQKTVTFIFGQIHLIDAYTNQELFIDNLYYDKPIKPLEDEKIIIAIPSSHSSYNSVKNSTNLIIKFIPKVIKN
ncbi:MAG: hypothetical protein N2446_02705 [Elusimicrobiales bacterium]|nr:hypothetical protein [Elusimicrobiales bacterium]